MSVKNQIFQNEKVFHGHNKQLTQRIISTIPRQVPEDLIVQLFCECADPHCYERVEIQINEFRKLEGEEDSFVVMPGHAFPRFERIVKRQLNYWIVQKIRTAREYNGTLKRADGRKFTPPEL